MARIESDPNYTAPTFSRATAPADLFKKEDVQNLAAAVSGHTHAAGLGLPIAAGAIPAGTITSAMIADGAITTADIGDSQITSAKIADGAVGTADIANGAVTTPKLAASLTLTTPTISGAATWTVPQDLPAGSTVHSDPIAHSPNDTLNAYVAGQANAVSLNNDSTVDITVSFGFTYVTIPFVIISCTFCSDLSKQNLWAVSARNVTTTGFTAQFLNRTGAQNSFFATYVAIGQH